MLEMREAIKTAGSDKVSHTPSTFDSPLHTD
jgi:hypothetical protein